MRALVLVVAVVGSLGCARKVIIVPSTPEGVACRRECMALFNECQNGKRKNRKACEARERECLLTTCPGAYVEGSQTASPVAPAAPVAAPAESKPPKCVASENPEWAGASAQRKKELLAECRGE